MLPVSLLLLESVASSNRIAPMQHSQAFAYSFIWISLTVRLNDTDLQERLSDKSKCRVEPYKA